MYCFSISSCPEGSSFDSPSLLFLSRLLFVKSSHPLDFQSLVKGHTHVFTVIHEVNES